MYTPQQAAERIVEVCRKKKLYISTALAEAGVNSSFLVNMRRGSYPSVDKVVLLADYLGVSVSYLLGTKEEYDEPGFFPASYMPLDNDLDFAFITLARDARKMPPADRKRVSDALLQAFDEAKLPPDRKSTRLNSSH